MLASCASSSSLLLFRCKAVLSLLLGTRSGPWALDRVSILSHIAEQDQNWSSSDLHLQACYPCLHDDLTGLSQCQEPCSTFPLSFQLTSWSHRSFWLTSFNHATSRSVQACRWMASSSCHNKACSRYPVSTAKPNSGRANIRWRLSWSRVWVHLIVPTLHDLHDPHSLSQHDSLHLAEAYMWLEVAVAAFP